MKRDPVAQVLDAVELLRRGAPDHAVDVVALLEQQLGQVGTVLAGDAGDQRDCGIRRAAPLHAAEPFRGLSQPLVHPDPGAPAEQPLRLLDGRPAAHDVDREARQVLELQLVRVIAHGEPAAAGDLGHRELLARRDVEVLVQPRFRARRDDDPVGDVVDVGQRARVLAGAEDRQRAQPLERLAQQVRHRVGDPRLGPGHLARPVGVERPADRVRQAVLVVRGAHVDLAGELREPVGRPRHRAVGQVLLGRREQLRALEHHARADVGAALDRLVQRGPEDRVIERVVDLGERVRELVEVGDAADDRRQVDDVRAAAHRPAGLVERAQVARVDLAALAHPVGRRALVGHAHLEVRVAQQAAHDRRADRAGAPGDQDPAHPTATGWARRRRGTRPSVDSHEPTRMSASPTSAPAPGRSPSATMPSASATTGLT